MRRLACLLLASLALPANAGPWLAPGDVRMRHDLQLLADEGIVQTPLTSWPVSWADVSRDIADETLAARIAPALLPVLQRVQSAARAATRTDDVALEGRAAASSQPVQLRSFEDTPREEGQVSAAATQTGERFAWRLQGTLVTSPEDGQAVRLDGSYAGVALGNWMLSAGATDRWWGPGWNGSLILGNNARPVPSITLERNYSDAFKPGWLRWLGRFRWSITAGQLEKDRDVPKARFMGARLTWKPAPSVEIGFSRSAQWCGDGRPCGLGTFKDLLLGNDNDQPQAQQPGNQMAGFDFRWKLPRVPVAVYAQGIGEDEANKLPSKYLGLFGAEAYGTLRGGTWRVHAEFADTTCNFSRKPPTFGCAYTNGNYPDGYRYRGRNLGHGIDADAEQVAVGALYVTAAGTTWQLDAQTSRLNRAGATPNALPAPVPTRWQSIDLAWRKPVRGADLRVSLGVERQGPLGGRARTDARITLGWHRGF